MSDKEVRKLATRLNGLERGIRGLSTSARLRHASIEDGALREYDSAGNLVSIIGKQPDGTHGIVNYVGPVPPEPSPPTAEGGPLRVAVTWGGTFANAMAPLDLLGIEVYAAATDFEFLEDATFVGRMPGAEAGTLNIALPVGVHYLALVAVTTSYRRSVVSGRVTAESTSVLDPSFVTDLENRLDAAETAVTAAQTELDSMFEVGGDGTVAISSAAGAAQQAAIAAAALDAQAKADAAAAAAELAAKAHADLVASGAEQAAIDAAALDAATKADAAQQAAIDAAALDAATKADAAQAAAIAAAAAAADSKIAAVPKVYHSTSDASGAAVDGSTWFKHAVTVAEDLSGQIVGQWTRTGGAWWATPLRHEVIASIDAGNISVGTLDTARLNALTVAAAVATIIELNADRIVAGTVDTARLNATEIAAAVATIIQLNADRITSGTVDTARLNATELAAAIATIIELNADRITSGLVTADQIDTTNLISEGVQIVDPAGGIRINLTGSGAQTLGIYDTTGLLMGSFDDLGVLTARKVVANDRLTVGGTDLVKTIRKLPRGVVAASTTFPSSKANVNSEWGLTEVMFTIPEHLDRVARLYRLTADLILSYVSKVDFNVRYTTNGTAPTITSSTMGTRTLNGTNVYTSLTPQWHWEFDKPAGTPIRCLITVTSGGGNFGWINSMNPRFIIEDVGEFAGFGGQVSAGGGSLPGESPVPPPSTAPTQQYVKVWAASSFQNYAGSNAATATKYDPGTGYAGSTYPMQGYYPSTAGGAPLRSHMFFNYQDIYNNLQGATIQGVEIYLMNTHWYASSGGPAKIAVHNYATEPDNFGASSPIKSEPFARGEGKWVWLSGAVATGFQNGTVKGLSLDSGASPALADYGYFGWQYGRPTLRITYTK